MKAFLNKPLIKNFFLPVLVWFLLSAVFGLAYTQSHLYNDNQNTKFLHGLAMGGMGLLQEDWLANTADPLPVFSLLVSVTYAFLAERLFYVYFALLMGVYAYSMLGIASTLYGMNRSPARVLAYFTAILAIHSIWGQIVIRKALGFEAELLHFGLAGQYLLGLDFQNSSFGVFLLLSIHAFLRRKNVWAVLWLSLACFFHSAYLFSAALMTAAYLGSQFVENINLGNTIAYSPSLLPPLPQGRGEEMSNEGMTGEARHTLIRRVKMAAKAPVLLGLLTLALVAPVVYYNQFVLSSTSTVFSEQALDILVNQRIPHHSVPRVWMNGGAYLQIAIMLAGLVLARKTRLFPVMLTLFLGGAVGTLVQVLGGSNSLALLAPWRVSVILVPLSTCLLIALPVAKFFDRFQRPLDKISPAVVVLCLAAIVFLAREGLTIQRGRFARYAKQEVHAVMNYIKQSKVSGQVYLIPPRDNRFDEFRTYTGAPAFINWKSHPYRDFEVLEWYQRNQLARAFYNQEPEAACATLAEIRAGYQLTHVVIDLEKPQPACEGMQEAYRDQHFVLYSLR
jgi:hypothetical protein